MSFGWKKHEHDIGPPHCRFQVRDIGVQGSSMDIFGSFGKYSLPILCLDCL